MTVEFYDNVNNDGLFDLLGKIFYAQNTLNTARLTTVPDEVIDAIEALQLRPVDAEITAIMAAIPAGITGFQASGNSLATVLQQAASALIVKMVNDDNPQPDRQLQTALVELIRQMIAESESVDASAIAVSIAADAGNTGDGVLIASTKRGDGQLQQNALAETLEAVATSDGATASISVRGEEAATLLSQDWPEGSGASRPVTAIDAASSLLANGDMEDEDDFANAPDDWIISVGTVGTTVKMTDVEVQTLTVTGPPTAGYYIFQISYGGVTLATGALAYNATDAQLQTAIRALHPNFSQVTVTATGTSPLFTHTITFTGAGGNLSEHTIINATTGGTYTPATSTGGSANVYAGGKALELDSDGSQLTTLQQRLTNLEVSTAYAVSLWGLADVVPAAGVITIDLVDGIGGTVIQDDQGVNNAFTFNAADLTTSWQHLSELVSGETVFRTPKVLPSAVYFRIRISTAVSSGTSVFLDHVALARMTELYSGGPLLAAFSGATPFKRQDKWTITVTNDRAGAIQEAFHRNFDMARLGLLLPYDTGGSETIPDSVIG